MRAGRTLRQIVIARIKDQVPALGGRVYDRATEDAIFPYCTLGPSYWTDGSVECIEAREVTLQADIWHSQASKGAAEDVVDDVAAALNGWADQNALTMHPASVSLVRIMDDPDGVTIHGVIQIEVMVEA
ncbi:DUF3168 domain-containing protein [Paracoccus sp. MBLB3053]|uniref:DUF3168 domain-containing protein n=1 Tax=Paracoccus aurantius TaxID=3073814 RepID=A0ABU2HUH3_9RHOB|nr:DUF3168 domain-containing protein [Paracoccus sp. MBLB3053]MDS9468697.1 DUF3168 domain-containing protein [Paracoccus sp. MBLB3053]